MRAGLAQRRQAGSRACAPPTFSTGRITRTCSGRARARTRSGRSSLLQLGLSGLSGDRLIGRLGDARGVRRAEPPSAHGGLGGRRAATASEARFQSSRNLENSGRRSAKRAALRELLLERLTHDPERFCDHAPERIRTSDLRFRKPLLYPAELRAHPASGIGTRPPFYARDAAAARRPPRARAPPTGYGSTPRARQSSRYQRIVCGIPTS